MPARRHQGRHDHRRPPGHRRRHRHRGRPAIGRTASSLTGDELPADDAGARCAARPRRRRRRPGLARGEAAHRPGAAGARARRGHDRRRRQRRAGAPRGRHRHRDGRSRAPTSPARPPTSCCSTTTSPRSSPASSRAARPSSTSAGSSPTTSPTTWPSSRRSSCGRCPAAGSRSPSACCRSSRSTSAPTRSPRSRSAPSRPAPTCSTARPCRAACSTAPCLRRAFGVLGPTEAARRDGRVLRLVHGGRLAARRRLPRRARRGGASGAAFMAVVFAQTANAFACRSATTWPGALGWTTNRLLIVGVSVGLVFSFVVLFVAPIADELRHAPPPAAGWTVAAASRRSPCSASMRS